MKRERTRILFAGFALALALLGAVAWFDLRHTARMEETAEGMAHTFEVQANLKRWLVPVQDSERDVELTLAALAQYKLANEAAVVRHGDGPLACGTGLAVMLIGAVVLAGWAEGQVNAGATFYYSLPTKGANYSCQTL